MTKSELVSFFEIFRGNSGGIDGWINENSPELVTKKLTRIDQEPLSKAQFNQLLGLSGILEISDDFFNWYWLSSPKHNAYDVTKVSQYNSEFIDNSSDKIRSIEHFYWGFYRFYIDALLYFGNVSFAFDELRSRSTAELKTFFQVRCFDSEYLHERGPAIELNFLPKDDRYLISEMACKSFDPPSGDEKNIKDFLKSALEDHISKGGGSVTFKELLSGSYGNLTQARQDALQLAADDIINDSIDTMEQMLEKITKEGDKFNQIRNLALENTHLYLSGVSDLDIYIATSMRTRQNFRSMAEFCESFSSDPRLKRLNLRYFDPTISAAAGHEDKGLIECLMVKRARVLIYIAGDRDSYGKDAEAAMALSLGKPVIFFCDQAGRANFYRDVHPLSRLVSFETGVAVGSIVSTSVSEVNDILFRLFNNQMEYIIEPKGNSLRLLERLTKSVIRIQSGDEFLRKTLMNYYKK